MRRRSFLAGVTLAFSGCLTLQSTDDTTDTKTPTRRSTATSTSTSERLTTEQPTTEEASTTEQTTTEPPQTVVNESPAPGKLAWTYDIPGQVFAKPAIGADHVFVGTNADRFFAIDKRTAEFKWEQTGDSTFSKDPLVTDYGVITGASKLYCYDPATGDINWEYSGIPTDGLSTRLNEDLLILDDLGKVARIKTQDGHKKWSTKLEDQPEVPPSDIQADRCLLDGTTPVIPFLNTLDEQLGFLQLDPDTGEVSSKTMTTDTKELRAPVVRDGTVVGIDGNNSIVAFDLETATVLWRIPSSRLDPAITPTPNGIIVQRPTESGSIMTFVNPETGTQKWKQPIDTCCHPVQATSEGVYWGKNRLKLDTGEPGFTFNEPIGMFTKPAIGEDLIVGFDNSDRTIRAIWRETA